MLTPPGGSLGFRPLGRTYTQIIKLINTVFLQAEPRALAYHIVFHFAVGTCKEHRFSLKESQTSLQSLQSYSKERLLEIYFSLCVYVCFSRINGHHMHAASAEARRGCRLLCSWSCRWLWTARWVLGTHPGYLVTTFAFNHGDNSAALKLFFM